MGMPRRWGRPLRCTWALPFQPSAAHPSLLPFEYAPGSFNRVGDLPVRPFAFENGVLQVPVDRPGLGIELDRDAVLRRLIS